MDFFARIRIDSDSLSGVVGQQPPCRSARAPQTPRGPHLLVGKDDPAGVVQRGLEGEAAQVVVVLQVDVVPLHHQGRSCTQQTSHWES